MKENKKNLVVLLFYKFVELKNPEEFINENQEFCKRLGVLGKVLVAREGINGSISGTREQTEEYKKFIKSYEFFKEVVFKEEEILEHPFTRMVTRLRDEIVALKKEVDTKNGGKYLKPEEFLEMYNKEKDIIILDTRNDYEYNVGRFKGALNPNIKTFREFPEFVEKFKENKDKKIVMYCTGGIRCEKASAYMKQEGFKEVYQLDGGIITYCQKLPNTLWEGQCFVFDKRLVTDVENKGNSIGPCFSCSKETDIYKNCRYPLCDNFVILCNECQLELNGCCSIECKEKNRDYFNKKSFEKRMKVKNI